MSAARKLAADASIAIGYVRVSTDEQSLGPDAQRAALVRWCTAQRAQLVAVHEDLGISGVAPLDRRPGLLAALEDLRARGAGVLLVAKRDRLARDVMVAAMVERLAERAGARILAADGAGNAEGPEGMLLRGIVDLFAAYERMLIKTRTKAALAVKRTRGERTGQVPYGWRLSADGVHLEADAGEAAIVAAARELRAQGLTLRAIGAELERRGMRPRTARRWAAQTIAQVVGR
jgi:DNA invertase Pin-like site-specific DNA recombinase